MNPEGKMFEPDYTETMSMLLDEIEKLHDGDVPLKEFDKGTEKYLKREGQRDGHWASGRSASKDGTTVLTDDDACECQQDENKATTNCNDQEPFRSIKTSTITSSIHTNAVKSDEKVESGFSYEDNDEDVQKSFGNSTILSRENSL